MNLIINFKKLYLDIKKIEPRISRHKTKWNVVQRPFNEQMRPNFRLWTKWERQSTNPISFTFSHTHTHTNTQKKTDIISD